MENVATGPVSFDDVAQALGDSDPGGTNASKLRAVIGRGSFATIQRHLDAIRAERAPAVPAAPGAIPPAPADAVAAIWGAAWAQAQAVTLSRLERLSAERDAAQALAAAQAQDVAGLAAEIDAMTAAALAQGAAQAQALEAAQATAAEAAALAQELATARAEIERITAAAAQAAALAQREAQIERQTLQTALERQIDRYTELKSVVEHLRPLAP